MGKEVMKLVTPLVRGLRLWKSLTATLTRFRKMKTVGVGRCWLRSYAKKFNGFSLSDGVNCNLWSQLDAESFKVYRVIHGFQTRDWSTEEPYSIRKLRHATVYSNRIWIVKCDYYSDKARDIFTFYARTLVFDLMAARPWAK